MLGAKWGFCGDVVEVRVIWSGLEVPRKNKNAILGMFGDDVEGFIMEDSAGIGIGVFGAREFGAYLVAIGI